MRNVHSRELAASPSAVAPLIDGLAGPDDAFWPTGWPPLRFDGPLGVGASGGHGPIRYSVTEYEPGRRLRCAFDPAIGVRGYHEFRVEPMDVGRVRLVHEIDAALRGGMRLGWPLAIRWLHDALIEDAFDNAERVTTGAVASPHRWSLWVRLLRKRGGRRPMRVAGAGGETRSRGPVAVAVPDRASADFGPADLADAYAVRLKPGMPHDAATWLDATFGNPPGWVRAAMGIRQAAVPLLGIERAPRDTFRPSALTERTATIDADANHLVFRAELVVDDRNVTVATLARAHNRRGRAYLAVVERVHPLVIRAMLRRATVAVARG
ncbi:DUF2867 domain-containing protein [Cryptosporangium minutisporangium]|uniref:DUF2867 domain-containing protein n=1 Tax=Cryptosporangium minutisporangium TaxID=113569 RepID=A0ABP6T750_9ACTN